METSRTEQILRATIDGVSYDAPPQSRIEALLLELKEAIEEGGSGGSTIKYGGRVDTVADLPETGEPNQFYFVGLETADNWDEYIWAIPGEEETGHWDRLGSVSIVIDDHLDATSTNPVQNRVITAAIPEAVTVTNTGDVYIGTQLIRKVLTQNEYDALATKDPKVDYCIIESV